MQSGEIMTEDGRRISHRLFGSGSKVWSFLLTHNRKDVAWDLENTQVVVFGHSHKYLEKITDGRLWLNPGEAAATADLAEK